jgi:hypothetical protein
MNLAEAITAVLTRINLPEGLDAGDIREYIRRDQSTSPTPGILEVWNELKGMERARTARRVLDTGPAGAVRWALVPEEDK